MINTPTSAFPRLCQNIISSENIYNTNNYFYRYKNYSEVLKNSNIDSRCNEIIYVKLNALQHDVYIYSLLQSEVAYDNNFNSSELVKDFVSYIEKNKNEIQRDYSSLEKSYKFKLEFMYLLFKFPLFIILFYMMRKHLLKKNYTLFIMFKSVFYTILMTILISMYTLISNLIPSGVIKNIIKSSYEVEAHIIFYYILMIILLFTFGYIIEKYQTRYRNRLKNCKSNNISRVVLHKCDDKLK